MFPKGKICTSEFDTWAVKGKRLEEKIITLPV
jgi:hypothetical protein